MAHNDDVQHLVDDARGVNPDDSKFVLVDQINGQSYGGFNSRKEAEDAARTGADFVGGVPWGEDGWEVVTLGQFKADLADNGVTFANGGFVYDDISDELAAARNTVISEIVDEIDSGNAHLMTRNELVEFIDWWINLDSDDNANAVIYDELNNGNASVARHQKIAKEFFVHKGYE